MLELPPLCCAKCKTLTCKILISLNKQLSEYSLRDLGLYNVLRTPAEQFCHAIYVLCIIIFLCTCIYYCITRILFINSALKAASVFNKGQLSVVNTP